MATVGARFWMLPATRSGSVRLTEIAIMPLRDRQASTWWPRPVAELARDDLLRRRRSATEAILPFECGRRRLVAGGQLVLRDAAELDLARGQAASYVSPAAMSCVALRTLTLSNWSLGAVVGALDVEEHQCRAHDSDEHGDDEEQPAAIHGRFTFARTSAVQRMAGWQYVTRANRAQTSGLARLSRNSRDRW